MTSSKLVKESEVYDRMESPYLSLCKSLSRGVLYLLVLFDCHWEGWLSVCEWGFGKVSVLECNFYGILSYFDPEMDWSLGGFPLSVVSVPMEG